MTTTTTVAAGYQRTPRIAALVAGAAFVVGAAIGVAWELDNSTPDSSHSPAYLHSYTRYFYWVAPTVPDELSRSTPGSRAGDHGFSGTTHPYPRSVPVIGSPRGYSTSQECRGCRVSG
jgi:hypothetical protein